VNQPAPRCDSHRGARASRRARRQPACAASFTSHGYPLARMPVQILLNPKTSLLGAAHAAAELVR
jgi:hypothetical protein